MKTKLAKLLFLSVLLTSCGPYKVEVSGEVDHKFSFDLDQLRAYFKKVCENKTPPVADVEECVDDMIGDLLATVAGH